MRSGILLAAFVVMAFAGCTSTAPPLTTDSGSQAPATAAPSAAPTSATTTAPATTSPAPTTTSAAPPPQPLQASLTAMVHGANATFHATAADPNGGKVTGTLDFGDGSAAASISSFPADVPHAYTSTGNLTARLTATNGKTTTKANVTFAIVAAAGSKTPYVFTGQIDTPDPAAIAGQGCVLNIVAYTGGPDNFGSDVQIPPGAVGGTYTIGPTGMEVDYLDSGGNFLSGGAGGTVPAGSTDGLTCGAAPTLELTNWTLTIVPK
ncbi:MAG: PKD domain-containing protein [Thermoplasmatota archaeon]